MLYRTVALEFALSVHSLTAASGNPHRLLSSLLALVILESGPFELDCSTNVGNGHTVGMEDCWSEADASLVCGMSGCCAVISKILSTTPS